MSDTPMALKAGCVLGRYTLTERLGAGGNATVFRALADNEDEVAIKVLHSDLVHEEDLIRFEREYNILQMVDHDRILRVFETGRTEGRHWIAMEYVDGEDVSEVANRWHSEDPPDRWKRIEKVLRGLAEALAHLHSQGIIHRDLKPTNVLVSPEGEPKLMDFGVIKAPDVFSTNLTVAGRLVGTVAFMAPEQITSEPVDHRADLYSLGAVLYVLLTNKRPIVADSIAGYLARQLAQAPRRPALVDASIPPKLDRICTKLLRKAPGERFESAGDVLAALDQEEEELALRLHGREAEQAHLVASLVALKGGASGCVGLIGPKGSGRSALLNGLEMEAKSKGVHFERVDADPQKIREQVTVASDRGPTALVVDDLDRSSALDLRGLAQVFDAIDSPLVLFFSATGAGEADPSINEGIRDLAEMPSCNVHWIEPLERKDVINLLRDQGLSPTAAAVIGRRLHAELEGLPGAVLAQLDALVDAGWLERNRLDGLRPKERLERFRDEPLPLPRSVREDIERRLQQLLPPDKALLNALSVLGGEATSDLLQAVQDYRRGSLDTLVKRSLVFLDSEGLHEVVCVTNPRIDQIVLESLSPEEKLSLHLRAAEGLLARNPRRVGSVARAVATHYLEANCADKAVPLLEQAAQRAARKKEFRKVLELTDMALQHEPSLSSLELEALAAHLSAIRALRGRALYLNDDLEAARVLLAQVLEEKILAENSPLWVAASVDLAASHMAKGDFAKSHALLEPLLARIEPGSPERLRSMRISAQCMRLEGQLERSVDRWREGLGVARDFRSKEQEAAFLLGLAKALLSQDSVQEGREALGDADVLLRGSQSLDRADCLLQMARLDYNDGLYRSALSRAEEGGEIAQELDAMGLAAFSLEICADCLEMVGLDRDAGRLSMEVEGLKRAQAGILSIAEIETPTARSCRDALRHAWDHHEAGRSEYGATLLDEALSSMPEGYRGLEAQLAIAQAQLTSERDARLRAKQLLEPLLEGLSAELCASLKAREDVASILEA